MQHATEDRIRLKQINSGVDSSPIGPGGDRP